MNSFFKKSVVIVCLVSGLAGCGGPPPPPPVTPKVAEQHDEKPVSNPDKQSAETQNAATPDKQTPESVVGEASAAGSVSRTIHALEAGNLTDAYDFLPPRYQSDVDGLIHLFADKVDPEIWSRLVRTMRKGISILRTRKEDFLALDLLRDHPRADVYRSQWDPTLELLQTVFQAETVELSNLKKTTARSMLSGKTSAIPHWHDFALALGSDLSRQFAGVTVTAVRSRGEEQVIAIRGPDDEQPIEVTYVKHDGHWLPKSLVESWAPGIESDRAWLEKLPERMKVVKPRILDALNDADQILDQLAAAGTREEFQQAAGPAILSLAASWPNLRALARQSMTGQAEPMQVVVAINRELTEQEQTRLVAEILDPLRESGNDYTLFANDGRTICRLSGINNPESLRTDLATHFALPVTDVAFDEQTARISIELAP